MLFDAQLQVAQFEIAPMEDHVQLAILIALSLPSGPNSVMPIPAGILRFGMGRDAAILHGGEMVAAGESLAEASPEKKSDIVIAQSLQGVDEAIKQAEKLTKKA